MNANELRIGNIVSINNKEQLPQLFGAILIFYCDNCSNEILFKELYKQDSDIFDDFIYLCPYCGGWVTI